MKRLLVYCILLISISLSQNLPSDKHWRFGKTNAIAVKGDTLLSQDGCILELFDIVDITNPNLISSIQLTEEFTKISVWNDYAFCLLKSKKLAVIDISNPLYLKIMNEFESNALDFTFFNDQLIIAKGEEGFSIYDLTNIQSPYLVENYTFEEIYNFKEVKLYEDLMYFNCNNKILVFDVSTFPKTSLITVINLGDFLEGYFSINTFLLTDGFLYLSAYTRGLITLDIRDLEDIQATSIKKFGGINQDYRYEDMLIVDNWLMVGTCYYQIYDVPTGLIDYYGDGIHVFDITEGSIPMDYSKIHFSNYYKNASYKLQLSKDNNTVISSLGYLGGFCFIDIENIDNPDEISRKLNPFIKHFSPYNDLIYYVGGESGVGILRNSSLELSELKRIEVDGIATGLYRIDKKLFVGIDSLGVKVFSLDNPEKPTEFSDIASGQSNFIYKGHYMLTWDHYSIKIYNTVDLTNPILISEFCNRSFYTELISNVISFEEFLIVIPENDSEKIVFYNIADLQNPQVAFHDDFKFYNFSQITFTKYKDFLYIEDYNSNYLYNVSNLDDIYLVYKNYFPAGSDAIIRDDLLYLQSGKLSIYDIVDFTNPQLLSQFNFSLSWNFYLYDNFLLHREGPYGPNLEIFRINDIDEIELLYSFPITDAYLDLKHSIFYKGELISRRFGGIEIFNFDYLTGTDDDYSEVINDFSIFNYPNPFNPSTNIKFTLPKSGNVKIYVYNILGEKITKLVDEYKNAGSYTVNFHAKHLSTGIYLYRLVCDDYSETKKMLLLK